MIRYNVPEGSLLTIPTVTAYVPFSTETCQKQNLKDDITGENIQVLV